MRVLKKELWPYKIVLDDDEHCHDIKQVESWLGEHMGAFRERWNKVYLFDETHFYFRISVMPHGLPLGGHEVSLGRS